MRNILSILNNKHNLIVIIIKERHKYFFIIHEVGSRLASREFFIIYFVVGGTALVLQWVNVPIMDLDLIWTRLVIISTIRKLL